MPSLKTKNRPGRAGFKAPPPACIVCRCLTTTASFGFACNSQKAEPSAETFTDVHGLVMRIYGDDMEGGVVLKAAIEDVLAISDHQAQEAVTPWPGIVNYFKNHKLSQGNRIKESTFHGSYERYLAIALLNLQGRNAAQIGKELDNLLWPIRGQIKSLE